MKAINNIAKYWNIEVIEVKNYAYGFAGMNFNDDKGQNTR